jgi:hypothetical protein
MPNYLLSDDLMNPLSTNCQQIWGGCHQWSLIS